MSASTIEVLRRARDLVARPGGWCQGASLRGEACCAAGAVHLVGWVPANNIAYTLGFQYWCDIAEWNDAPGRTQAEVIELFSKAIARLEAEERGR